MFGSLPAVQPLLPITFSQTGYDRRSRQRRSCRVVWLNCCTFGAIPDNRFAVSELANFAGKRSLSTTPFVTLTTAVYNHRRLISDFDSALAVETDLRPIISRSDVSNLVYVDPHGPAVALLRHYKICHFANRPLAIPHRPGA